MSISRMSSLLLGTAAALVIAVPAAAAQPAPSSNDDIQARLAQLQQQIDDLNATIGDLKRGQSAQYSDMQKQRSQDVQISFKNGRPTFRTADGEFSVSLRTLLQFDTAYYGQGKVPAGTDFSSGSNFRRARLGFSGTLFKDWSYEFLYDLGGSGSEAATISSAYIQYDGMGAVHFRIGAFAPFENLEDSTAASDLMFLERAQPSDLARGIAASDGRDAVALFAYGDDYFASVSYTGGLVGDAGFFDEQQAVIARGAYRLVDTADANLVLSANTTYLFKLADTVAGANSPHALRLRERPELNVDDNSIRLIDTGNIDASSYVDWAVETAGNWKSLYGQGGYFGYDVTRRASVLPNPDFEGWYAQASWVITGEAKPYKPERGAFGLPSPTDPFSFGHPGWGAWEIAARYSDLDLNYNSGVVGTVTPVGGIRGGEQRIFTAGLNWYPNAAIRFELDYQHTDVSRLSAAGVNSPANLDAASFRMQLAL